MSNLDRQPDDKFSLQPDPALAGHLPSDDIGSPRCQTLLQSFANGAAPSLLGAVTRAGRNCGAFANHLPVNPTGSAELPYREPLYGTQLLR